MTDSQNPTEAEIVAFDVSKIIEEYRSLPPHSPARKMRLANAKMLTDIGATKLQPARGVPTPWDGLNRVCRGSAGGLGLPYGGMAILAGGTGAGKSLLALHIVDSATRSGINTGLISLEMGAEENYTRLLALSTGAPIRKLEHGEFMPAVWDQAVKRFLDPKERTGALWMNQEPTVRNLKDIILCMRVLARKYGVEFITIDYGQYINIPGENKRSTIVAEAARQIDQEAKDLGICVLLLSQISREGMKPDGNPPTKYHLQWSSVMEQDARMVMIMDPTRSERSDDGLTARMPLVIDKNRSGPESEILIEWDYTTLRAAERDGLSWDKVSQSWTEDFGFDKAANGEYSKSGDRAPREKQGELV